MGFDTGGRNLWDIFLEFLQDKSMEDGYDTYTAPESFWYSMTHEQFKSYCIHTIQSRETSNHPTPRNRNSPIIHSPSPTVSFGSTPMQRNVTERTHNIPRMSSLGAFTPTVASPSPTKSIQTINPIIKKQQKITDYPTFSGQQADWRLFERKFIAIANSQNYGHVLDLNITPTPEQEDEYKADLKYIYQAFSVSWSSGLNYNIVNDHKRTQDGRAIYVDALKYFQGGAFTQVELQTAITNLVNNKLSPTTHDGAEGYNSKFNDYIATIERAGVALDNQLVKCLYLAIINDDLYTTIKDQTSLDKMNMLEIQSLMLKNYTTTLNEINDTHPRPHRHYHISSDIDQESFDSPLTSTQYEVTSGRTPSPPISTKPPISGKNSPTPNNDPFHIEKSEWMTLSSFTKEKINTLKKQLRDLQPSSSNIHLLRSLDDTSNEPSPTPIDSHSNEEQDPFVDTMRQFMIRAHRQLVTAVTRVRSSQKLFHIFKHRSNPVYGRLISDSGADTGA